MRYFSLVLVVLLSACRTTGINSNTELSPYIGETFPILKRTSLLMIGPSQASPSTKIVNHGIEYTVAVDNSDEIIYISTDSPAFHTPEGFSLGSNLEEILASGGSEVVYETGWAHYSVLPSGWCAAFYGDLVNNKQLFSPPIGTSKVSYYFKRK